VDEFIDRLVRLLTLHFPGSIPELNQLCPLQRVGGFLIWPGFDGIDQLDRQRQVGAVIRSSLAPQEQLMVSTILTLTPEESELMRTD
jgi:hypothetical protein